MEKILVSACLLGEKVRYDGGDCMQSGRLTEWQREGRLVPFCPEVAGGLPVPRKPAEIEYGDAEAVLCGKASVCNCDGVDVSDAFVEGAERALALCMKHHIHTAILKEGSPSCGSSRINDGSFNKQKVAGYGVTTALLRRHGISVISEEDIDGQ